VQATRVLDNGEVVLVGQPPVYVNMIEEFQSFDVDVYVNTYTRDEFFSSAFGRREPRITKEKPVWQLKGLNFTTEDLPSFYTYDFNYTLDFSPGSSLRRDVLVNNKTLYVHMQTKFKNPLHSKEAPHSARLKQLLELMPTIPKYMPSEHRFNSSLPLFDYMLKSNTKQASNLFSDYDLPKEAQDPTVEVDTTYYPHLKQEVNLHQIVDFTHYRSPQEFPPQLYRYFKVEHNFGLFEPI